MNNERILEIKRRHESATPGTWNSTGDAVRCDHSPNGWICQMFEGSENSEEPTRDFENAFINAEFIAHSPDDISYLLSEVERLQSQITEMEYPKAMGRDVTYGGWRLDYQFLHDVEMEIRKSVFWEECPSMEGIELALLTAQEVIKRRALSHLKG